MTPRLLLKGLVLIVTLLGIGWAMQALGVGHMLDKDWVDSAVKGQGAEGVALFLGLGGLVMAVGLPRQGVCFLAGYAGGLLYGTALALAASLLGCALAFFYARLLGREVVRHRLEARVRRVDEFLSRNPFTMTVLIRFLPVGSNLITNLVAGVSRVPAAPFLAGSLVGYVPQTFIFALLGSGVRVDPGARIGLSVVLFIASAALGVILYRRVRPGSLEA